MTIEEIEKTLPNGFHDSNLKEINIDYMRKVAKIHLEINMGTPEDDDNQTDENYSKGILTISELLFCVIEPPDPQYPYKDAKGLWITSSGPIKSARLSMKFYEALPSGFFDYYFFINNWNSFICLAARDARFDWI